MRAVSLLLPGLLAVGVLALPSCGGGRDIFPEAESLEKAGDFAGAADRYDRACASAPGSPHCGQADGRAFAARMKGAEAEIAQGHFLAAERMILLAELTADDAARKRAQERLEKEDLRLGVRYERALGMADKRKVAAVLEPIASSATPAAAKAREWIDKEGPAVLAGAVTAACTRHEGSCSEAFAKLQAGAKGAEVEEAVRAAEAEQRRVYPLRVQGESFVRVFASQGQKQKAFEKCQADKAPDGAASSCFEDVFGTEPDDKQYQAKKNNETLFRRLLKQIADPALARDLEARKARALAEGVAQTAEIPKLATAAPAKATAARSP